MSFDEKVAKIILGQLTESITPVSWDQLKQVCVSQGATEAGFISIIHQLEEAGRVRKVRQPVGGGSSRKMANCYTLPRLEGQS